MSRKRSSTRGQFYPRTAIPAFILVALLFLLLNAFHHHPGGGFAALADAPPSQPATLLTITDAQGAVLLNMDATGLLTLSPGHPAVEVNTLTSGLVANATNTWEIRDATNAILLQLMLSGADEGRLRIKGNFYDSQIATNPPPSDTHLWFVKDATGKTLLSVDQNGNLYGALSGIPPTNLTATAVSSNRIDLTWTNPSNPSAAYYIFRSSNGGSFPTDPYATVDGSGTSYSDMQCAEYTKYIYKIQSGGNYSNQADATTLLVSPFGVQATPISDVAIQISWQDDSTQTDFFSVERCDATVDPTKWEEYWTVGSGQRSLLDMDGALEQGHTYKYRLQANSPPDGNSTYSNEAEGQLLTPAPGGGCQELWPSAWME